MINIRNTNRSKIFLSWLWVALCVLAIFLIVPLARSIQTFVSTHWGRSLFGYSVLIVTGGAFLTLLSILFFRLKIRSLSNYFWLSLVTALYVYFTIKLWKVPEEAIHFLEYGLLGFFIFRALSFYIKDKTIYFAAFFFGSLVGIFDEILQWMIPLRYWALRDVGLNALSSILIQVAIWKGIKPKLISHKIRIKSVKISSFLLAANLFLLGLCLSNTPKRVSSYIKLFPALSFLQKEEAMNEFKHKHKVPEIGIFYSRLNLEELVKIDKENSQKNARILKAWKKRKYAQFLRNFPGPKYPLLHEFRVHVFRRNKKFSEGLKAEDMKTRRISFFISYKENLILEKYFGKTLQKSSYKWRLKKINKARALIDKKASYTSPVSSGIFATVSEKTIWIVIFTFLIILSLFNLILSRSKKLY